MSGHSKWSTIKRQKAVVDAKRGAIFTKIANLITLSAKEGGDPEMNPTLKSAIEQAKEANMPKVNIERAIKKGTGELAGEEVLEIIYEGIGPFNTQFVIKCLTDNRNRSIASLRHIFSKYGGSLASVLWNFDMYGKISFSLSELSKNKINLESLELELIDQGIVDIIKDKEKLIIITNPKDLAKNSDFLRNKGIKFSFRDIVYIAKEKQIITKEEKLKIDNLIEEIENNEDVNSYYHNLENIL
jgi:YebC/PmpR family DNA-binding regulatory protein